VSLVTALVRSDGRLLLVPDGDGRLDGLSTRLAPDADPLAPARAALADRGIDATHTRTGAAVSVAGRTVRPVLFDAPALGPLDGAALVHPPALRALPAVPGLCAAYRRVAPSLATVRDDREHGSTTLSYRALECLRDRAGAVAAGAADDGPSVVALARRLRTARPAMLAVRTRIDRAMTAAGPDHTPAAVRDAACGTLDDAVAADRAAARRAAALLDGPVATCSRSGTVATALAAAGVPVVVGESRPGGEGRAAAAALADAGLDATLVPDAALPGAFADGTAVPDAASALVGADAVGPDGSAVNKVGSTPLARAARAAGRPVRVVATRDKVAPAASEPPAETAAFDAPAGVTAAAPVFERLPADLVTAVVTEVGPLDAAGIGAVAATNRAAASWVADADGAGDGTPGPDDI
jgi:translation initiation factor 2B subunit (eIF-2B alpha/beta/delta family)